MKEPVWSDIDSEFRLDSTGGIAIRPDVEAVRQSIDNILRTRKGERLFLPQFGSSLEDLIFEPMDEMSLVDISRRLKDEIEYWDDRVIVDFVGFEKDEDRGTLSLLVRFSIRGKGGLYTFRKALLKG